MNADDALQSLTRIPEKRRLYRRETYFREGLYDALTLWDGAFDDVLSASSLLMLKPDGIAAHKLPAVSAFLDEHGFEVVEAAELHLDRWTWRELWRYQLTSATLDRLEINDHLFSRDACVVLLLRRSGEHPEPATVRLSGLKGSSTVSAQSPGSLRSILGQHNRVLSFVHVADEPADLLRELALFFDRRTRMRLMSTLMRGGMSVEGKEVFQRVAAGSGEPRSLDPAAARSRIRGAVEEWVRRQGYPSSEVRRLRQALSAAGRPGAFDLKSFVLDLEDSGVAVDPWDLVAFAAGAIVNDEPGEPKHIQNPPPGAWAAEAR